MKTWYSSKLFLNLSNFLVWFFNLKNILIFLIYIYIIYKQNQHVLGRERCAWKLDIVQKSLWILIIFLVWFLVPETYSWRLDIVHKSLSLLSIFLVWRKNMLIRLMNNMYIRNSRTFWDKKLWMKTWYSLKFLMNFISFSCLIFFYQKFSDTRNSYTTLSQKRLFQKLLHQKPIMIFTFNLFFIRVIRINS